MEQKFKKKALEEYTAQALHAYASVAARERCVQGSDCVRYQFYSLAKRGNLRDCNLYLAAYKGQSEFEKHIRDRREALREDSLYKAATRDGSIAALKRFCSQHPASQDCWAAAQRILEERGMDKSLKPTSARVTMLIDTPDKAAHDSVRTSIESILRCSGVSISAANNENAEAEIIVSGKIRYLSAEYLGDRGTTRMVTGIHLSGTLTVRELLDKTQLTRETFSATIKPPGIMTGISSKWDIRPLRKGAQLSGSLCAALARALIALQGVRVGVCGCWLCGSSFVADECEKMYPPAGNCPDGSSWAGCWVAQQE